MLSVFLVVLSLLVVALLCCLVILYSIGKIMDSKSLLESSIIVISCMTILAFLFSLETTIVFCILKI